MSQQTQPTEKSLTYNGFRAMATWFTDTIHSLWGQEKNNYIDQINYSAFAANNAINVGMSETAEVLNPMLKAPSTEQIYTTQPQWDFVEDTNYLLGGYADIADDGTLADPQPTYSNGVWTPSEPASGYKRYPIPSLVYDSEYVAGASDENEHKHVVFPIWMWDGTTFGFKSMEIKYKHNCNYLGGCLDGFKWQEVSLTSGSSVTVSGDAQEGFTASVPTTATVAVGTWVRLTYTESDASKTAYGYVSAVGEGNVTVTVVGACGTTVTKVELYKPLQG